MDGKVVVLYALALAIVMVAVAVCMFIAGAAKVAVEIPYAKLTATA